MLIGLAWQEGAAQVSVGIHGGGSFSNWTGDLISFPESSNAYKIRSDFYLGLALGWEFNEYASVLANLDFIQKGTDFQSLSDERNLEQNIRMDYLTIPIMFRLSLPQDLVKPYLQAGPYLGFLATARQDIRESQLDGTPIRRIEDLSVINQYASVDYGIALGLGTEVLLAENYQRGGRGRQASGASYWLTLGAQVQLGLADVNKDEALSTRINAFTVGLGLTVKVF